MLFSKIYNRQIARINMNYFVYFIIFLIIGTMPVYAEQNSHLHNEYSYQHEWCSAHNGIEEFENRDKTRVDCLTITNAVEFDFANKWAESIGQALYYQFMTGKRAKVVLILENPYKEMVYFKRIENLAKIYDFDVEYVTNDILQLENGKCRNIKCKCHKKY